jgi:N-acetylglucosamine kinase-like BadF-type ATPase
MKKKTYITEEMETQFKRNEKELICQVVKNAVHLSIPEVNDILRSIIKENNQKEMDIFDDLFSDLPDNFSIGDDFEIAKIG